MTLCCPCDKLIHPGKPEIPAGLAALPRQLAEFSDYRLAMLREIPNQPALAQWRAREGDDLGIMLLEMWAYVLDSLAFYDERIANEAYLRTAVRQASLYKLVGLIGYYPRPALAATVVLGAITEGRQQIVLPPRTGFRSDAFDGEPPQIFETEVEQSIHPFLNEWELADIRAPSAPKELLLTLETARLAAEQLVLVKTANSLQAGKVAATSTITALDGNSYVQVMVKPAIALAPTVRLNDIEVLTPERTAQPSLMTESAVISPFFSAPVLIVLDAIYPELAEGEPVIVQRGSDLFAANLGAVSRTDINVGAGDPPPTLPVTIIVLDRFLPEAWTFDPSRLQIHFQLVNAGTVTRVAKTQLTKVDFETPGIPIEGLAEPLPDDVSTSELLLQDANSQGLQAGGTTLIDAQGNGRVVLNTNTPEFTPLRTPVNVFGNLVRASRGESVLDEVLGSGNGAEAFQSFTLQKTPLTYLSDPVVGRRSTLSIRVNGILWREVVSFFGAGPQDEVFIARQNDQQETTITFGDGVTGARLPTGINNVTATYRFGGGAAKPPAGAIAQIAKPFKGLRRVVNPVAAIGGADSDRPEAIRLNAPTSALTLGRAVSIQDFEALAREFGGVVNARAGWAWDESRQGAVVKVWFITDGDSTNPDFIQELTDALLGQADPTTPLKVCPAVAQPGSLVIDVSLDPRFSKDLVLEEIRQVLVNEATGLFALTHIPLGRPLFRSQIFASVLSVEGTCGVSAITLDGAPVPFAIAAAEGYYQELFSKLVVVGTAATEVNAP